VRCTLRPPQTNHFSKLTQKHCYFQPSFRRREAPRNPLTFTTPPTNHSTKKTLPLPYASNRLHHHQQTQNRIIYRSHIQYRKAPSGTPHRKISRFQQNLQLPLPALLRKLQRHQPSHRSRKTNQKMASQQKNRPHQNLQPQHGFPQPPLHLQNLTKTLLLPTVIPTCLTLGRGRSPRNLLTQTSPSNQPLPQK
jgi:hypothetical protein